MSAHDTTAIPTPRHGQSTRPASGRLGFWAGARATVGALLGLVPHVLHHVGFIAGAALLTGVVGNTILYAVGMLLSIPMLIRLRRRFGTWVAPALGAVVFTGLFALSALVIGPALGPSGATTAVPSAASPSTPAASPDPSAQATGEHDGHHP